MAAVGAQNVIPRLVHRDAAAGIHVLGKGGGDGGNRLDETQRRHFRAAPGADEVASVCVIKLENAYYRRQLINDVTHG